MAPPEKKRVTMELCPQCNTTVSVEVLGAYLKCETCGMRFPKPRKKREREKLDGRTTEIQRLIGRSLRAVAEFVKGIGDSDAVFKRWGIGIALAAAALGPFLFGIGQITIAIGALLKDLKQRGFKFVGSTVIYAHMQACGLVNDHLIDCWRYKTLASK